MRCLGCLDESIDVGCLIPSKILLDAKLSVIPTILGSAAMEVLLPEGFSTTRPSPRAMLKTSVCGAQGATSPTSPRSPRSVVDAHTPNAAAEAFLAASRLPPAAQNFIVVVCRQLTLRRSSAPIRTTGIPCGTG